MSVQSSKFLLALALTGMLGPMPARMFGQAAGAVPSAAPQKNWKDRTEFDLFDLHHARTPILRPDWKSCRIGKSSIP